jgi:hypothetical protein
MTVGEGSVSETIDDILIVYSTIHNMTLDCITSVGDGPITDLV